LRLKNKRKPASQGQGRLALYLRRVIVYSSVGLIAVGVLTGAYHVAKAFYVRDIRVSGCNRLDKSDVQDMLDIKGEPLLNLHLKDIETKLMRNAWIKNVSLRWLLPGTIMVHIEEAAPKALLSYRGEMFLVNEEGNIMEELEEQSTPFLPVINGIDPRYKKVMSEAMKLVEALNAKNIIAERQYVEVGLESFGLTANIDGEFIKVGYGEYGEKFEKWAELEPELKRRGVPIQYIDLRFKDSVVVKPAEEGKEKEEAKDKVIAKNKREKRI